MTTPDTIRYAELDGVFLIKFEGDIRVTLCASFDDFIATMFAEEHLRAIILDLEDAKNIDSTALGMIAKIASQSQTILKVAPTVISNNPDIDRTLECMGLDQVLNIIRSSDDLDKNLYEHIKDMPRCDCTPEEMCERVLEAHKNLMELNANNREIFKDLVSGLEKEKLETSELSAEDQIKH